MTTPFRVVFPLFAGVTQLDFTGPLEVLSRLPRAECILASVEGGTLTLGGGLVLSELARLSDVPDCALLCVPGGYGTVKALDDTRYLAELARLGRTASTVTSVCTGSLLLAAAGLLAGKRAACHWAWRDLLEPFGVVPDPSRVVRDGNVITGGGVTAGIDMALSVLAELEGPDFARAVTLALEYAPEPPFEPGRPELAKPEILRTVSERLERLGSERRAAVARAAARLGTA
jgi:transcriptional regulator GlxA family with amidase domain